MHDIAVIAGDGIGPEVTREALKVLTTASEVHGFRFRTEAMPYGADHYLKTRETFPDSALRQAHDFDAIFLGAIGDPRVETGLLERAIIAGLRFGLDLYVNLRPVRLFDARFCPLKDRGPEDLDFIVVRENTEDAYAGLGGILKKGTPNEVAVQEMIYTRSGVERVVRYAYDLCQKRAKHKRLTLVDKANAIRCQDIWTRTFAEVGLEYDDIQQDHAYVDAACMWMVKNPEWFDVIVTTNLFGDILTDLGAQLVGGMGIAASGNIHPGRVSMFEPIHGSAPKYAGKNTANPLAAICAVGMMLDHLGETEAALAVENGVRTILTSGKVKSLKAGTLPTNVLGDMVAAEVRGARRTISGGRAKRPAAGKPSSSKQAGPRSAGKPAGKPARRAAAAR